MKNSIYICDMTIEKMLIDHLSSGKTQKEISDIFKSESVYPNSLSIIEKILKSIRAKYGAKSMFHLAVILNQHELDRMKRMVDEQRGLYEALQLVLNKERELNS